MAKSLFKSFTGAKADKNVLFMIRKVNGQTEVWSREIGGKLVEVVVGDITTLAVDAIVNAANKQLKGGGGVDGAIHRAAGPELLEASLALGGCETGDARMTPGFRLPAGHVIHAVGPVWGGDKDENDRLLASCYETAIRLAEAAGLASIAFPAISTGIYGFPADRAAGVAARAGVAGLRRANSLERLVYCCFSDESVRLHVAAIEAAPGV